MEAMTLAKFDLLRDSRQDIRQQPWTQPAHRKAMNLYFGIKRAKEEILHLNIEIRRLVTFMIDDHRDFYRAVAANILQDPHLASELSHQWKYRQAIHAKIVSRLHQTSRLKGFTGTLLPSVREGCDAEVMGVGGLPGWAHIIFEHVETYDEVEFGDTGNNDEDGNLKEVVGDSGLVVQLLENIALQDGVDNSDQ
jgi:hypothetical protein